MDFNQKLRAMLKENCKKAPGPVLTKGLSLFISGTKAPRPDLSTGRNWRQPQPQLRLSTQRCSLGQLGTALNASSHFQPGSVSLLASCFLPTAKRGQGRGHLMGAAPGAPSPTELCAGLLQPVCSQLPSLGLISRAW